ncbi:hypothetical protein FRX31_009681 [Thalictrum thalictroides]|uniref:Agenet domain-containing protein n=1 Tax=Thalictrum thalictroides TaxID=46969 RepID=A0A7J6WUL2_THATH|nr:hypothetical protein FRX31_009681 [Thalictrum thalictroides]
MKSNGEFVEGQVVEVTSTEQGFEDSWFIAKLIRTAKSTDEKVLVEYRNLGEDTDMNNSLREFVDLARLRPIPPKETTFRRFQLNEEVDAFFNDGWWKGVVSKICTQGSSLKYSVFFNPTKEVLDFEQSDLRTHLDWNGEKWVCFSNQVIEEAVEVRLDDETCHGAWFPATILKHFTDYSVLVAYKRLRFGQVVEQLTEIVDSLHVRPSPPHSSDSRKFDVLEKVDAFYDFGWWTGVITKVLPNDKYIVFFKHQNEEKEFTRSDLRLHMDWIEAKIWFLNSKETDVPAQNEVSVQALTPTGSSALKSEIAPSGSRDIMWKDNLSSRSICGRMDDRSIRNETARSNGEVGPVKIVREGETTQTLTCIKACNAREAVLTQENKSRGVGRVDPQEQVSKRKRERHPGSGKKQKRELTKNLGTPSQSKGHENESASKEMTDVLRESSPSLSEIAGANQAISVLLEKPCLYSAKDVGEMTDVQTECSPVSNHMVDEHQPLSVFHENSRSCIVKNIIGLVDKQIVDVSQRKKGQPEGSIEKASTKGPEHKAPSEEITFVQTESTQLLSHTAGKNQLSLENSNAPQVKVSGGVDCELASKGMMVVQTESTQVLSYSAGKQLLFEKSSSPAVKVNGGVSTDNQLRWDEASTQVDASMESHALPESINVVGSLSLEECITFDDQYQFDNGSGDESALSSANITANTILSPKQQDGGHSPPQGASLPFTKMSNMWGVLNSMEVFQLMPQNPHFRPLEKYNEELREGFAVGSMLNFANVVERIWKANLDVPKSFFENKFKVLKDLEDHGFTVQPVRMRLEELRKMKDSYNDFDGKSKTAELQLIEGKCKDGELQESIAQLQMKLQALTKEKELNDSNVAELQRTADAIKEKIHGVRLNFDSMVACKSML